MPTDASEFWDKQPGVCAGCGGPTTLSTFFHCRACMDFPNRTIGQCVECDADTGATNRAWCTPHWARRNGAYADGLLFRMYSRQERWPDWAWEWLDERIAAGEEIGEWMLLHRKITQQYAAAQARR